MKILASDYDGTLKQYSEVMGKATIDKRDREAIVRFRKQGNLFGIVTGRSKGMIYQELEKYGIEWDFLVAQNGSVIWNRGLKVLYAREISHPTADALVKVLKTKKTYCYGISDLELSGTLYQDEKWFAPSEVEDVKVTVLTDQVYKEMKIISFFIKACSVEEAEELAEELNREFAGELTFHCNKDAIDVTPYGVNKETGVRWIEEYYSPQEIAVIGDALNDLPMIRAYHGYYISGGNQQLKQYGKREFANIAECITHMMEE